MPFGYAPYSSLDDILKRRLAQQSIDVPGVEYPFPENGIAPPAAPRRRRFLSEFASRPGAEAIAAGLEASLGEINPLAAGLKGFSTAFATKYRAAAGEQEAKRRSEIEERRVVAEETRAARETQPRDTTAQELEAEVANLRALGATDDQIRESLLGKMRGGRGGGGGRLTDLDKVAHSMVAKGLAEDLDEGYLKAKTILQQPQFVGQVEKFETDPNNLDNFIRVRLNVYRRLNPITQDFETVDEMGRPLTEEDLKTLRTDPGKYQGGRIPAPTQPRSPVGLVPSHETSPLLIPRGRPSAADFDR